MLCGLPTGQLLGGKMKNIWKFVLVLFLSLQVISCSKPQDKINLFEDVRLSDSKENISQLLISRGLSIKTAEDYKIDEEKMTDEDKEKMPEDYIKIDTSIYGKNSIVYFYFWNNELYKINLMHLKPLSEKDKLKANQDLIETFTILDEKVQGYFVSTSRNEFTDIVNNKHVSFDIGFDDNIDIKIDDFSVTLYWLNIDIEKKVELEKEKYKEMIKRQNPEYYGKWKIQDNDICYLAGINGVFSNSVTNRSKLLLNCYIVNNGKYDDVEFRFYEYGSQIVKSASWRKNSFFIYVTDLNTNEIVSGNCYLRQTELELGEVLSKKVLRLLQNDNPNVSFYISEFDTDTKYQFILSDEIYGISKAMQKRKTYVKE